MYFSTDKGGPGKDSLIFNLSPDQSVFPNSVPEEKKKLYSILKVIHDKLIFNFKILINLIY